MVVLIGQKNKAKKTQSQCEAFMDGLLDAGVHSAYELYLKFMKSLTYRSSFQKIASAEEFNKTEIDQVFEDEELKQFITLEKDYMQTQLGTLVVSHAKIAKELLLEEQNLLLILLIAFIFGVIFIYVFVLSSIIHELDMDVKRTRSLLLIIPEDVLENLVHLQRFLVQNFSAKKHT